jgi:hypothetical protein
MPHSSLRRVTVRRALTSSGSIPAARWTVRYFRQIVSSCAAVEQSAHWTSSASLSAVATRVIARTFE